MQNYLYKLSVTVICCPSIIIFCRMIIVVLFLVEKEFQARKIWRPKFLGQLECVSF